MRRSNTKLKHKSFTQYRGRRGDQMFSTVFSEVVEAGEHMKLRVFNICVHYTFRGRKSRDINRKS